MVYGTPSCGCLPGDRWNGWLEIHSTYCKAEELRQLGLVMEIAKRIGEEKNADHGTGREVP